jgi:basic membrane protein A
MEAFKLGAKASNPDAVVTIVYIGSFEDVAKAKEAALAQISSGADVVYHIADAAGVGVIQAAEEKGVYAIGWGLDQNAIAPNTVITSEIVDTARMMYLEVKDIQDGNFEGAIRFFGLDTGVTGLSDYHGLVPDDVAQQIEETKQKIVSGELEVPFIPTPSE